MSMSTGGAASTPATGLGVASAAEMLFERWSKEDESDESDDAESSTGETESQGDEGEDASEEAEGEESETDEESEEEGEESSAPEIDNLEKLAEALGVEPDKAAQSFKVKFKSAGEETEKTLAELIQTSQKFGDYTKKTQQLSSTQKELLAGHKQAWESFQANTAAVVGAVNAQKKRTLDMLNSPEVVRLKATDPARYLMAEREIQGEVAALDKQLAEASQRWSQQMQQYREERAARTLEIVRAKKDLSREEADEGIKTLADFGFGDAELAELDDARVVALAAELNAARRELQTAQAKADAGTKALKKGRPVQKVLKPGSAQPRSLAQQTQVAELNAIKKLQKSGSVRDAAEALALRFERRGKRK